MLLRTGRAAVEAGHEVLFVITRDQASHDRTGHDAFADFAGEIGADHHRLDSVNRPKAIALMRGYRTDIALTVNWPVMIGEQACASFPLGILNLHAGDLPRYRGNATPNWAILNDETHMGICVHRIDPYGLDTGPVVSRDRIPIDHDTYISDLYDVLERRGPELFVEALARLTGNQDAGTPQDDDPEAVLRCYPRRPEDSRIDWRGPATMIHRLVRASSRPFQGAFCYMDSGERVTVWRADPYHDATPFLAIPGQVLLRADGMPVIACGDGALRLTEVDVGEVRGEAALALVGKSLRGRLH